MRDRRLHLVFQPAITWPAPFFTASRLSVLVNAVDLTFRLQSSARKSTARACEGCYSRMLLVGGWPCAKHPQYPPNSYESEGLIQAKQPPTQFTDVAPSGRERPGTPLQGTR
jgi:hypothetical protein